MIESPVLIEFAASERRKATVEAVSRILRVRFGLVPPEITAVLRGIEDEETLKVLIDLATACPDLKSFRAGSPS